MSSPVMLKAINLTRRYGARTAVDAVSFELRRGEILGLLGLNGAGKSTTLQMLAGVLAPHAGAVEVAGLPLANKPCDAKRALGFLPEVPPVYADATVDEYLHFAAVIRRVPAAARGAAVSRVKARCQLADVGPRLIGNLSKGYQQRVGIAQALVHEPAVLILDEPTVGLDPAQIQEVRSLLKGLREAHAIVLSTHLLSEVESVCTRVAILHQGRLVHDASLIAQSLTWRVRFAQTPSPQALKEVLPMVRVTVVNPHEFELAATDGQALDAHLDELTRAAVTHAWGLRELSSAGSALERTFLALTRDHSAVKAG